MRFPIQFHAGSSDMNYHGRPGRTTLTSTASVVRLTCAVPAWRFIVYGQRGQWWYFDVFFRGFR